MRFIYLERQKLPEEILKHNVDEKRQFLIEINMDSENNDAEVQVKWLMAWLGDLSSYPFLISLSLI